MKYILKKVMLALMPLAITTLLVTIVFASGDAGPNCLFGRGCEYWQ